MDLNKIKPEQYKFITSYYLDMDKQKYSIKDLEFIVENFKGVSLKKIVQTQELTKDFCVNLILNDEYQFLDYDDGISVQYILEYQKQLISELS